ncbi:MAG: hypothetical protein JWN71_299 [Xanthobacteraceae bacterium]|nr:hypothetical protein [Xanthobacteraceae bacterium]
MTVQFKTPKTRVERGLAQAPRTYSGESTVATVWLMMYVLVIGVAVVLPMLSKGIEVAAR